MNLARNLRVLLTVALLAAWQNALVHPIEHVDEAGSSVHLADSHAPQDHGGQKNAPDLLCDAIAAVAACIDGSTGFVFAVPQGVAALCTRQAVRFRGARLLAYRSQAPPHYS